MKIQNVTSKCPLGICDGSGVINQITYEQGQRVERVEICNCMLDRDEMKRRANIPSIFQDSTINSFETEIYSKENTIAKAAKKAAARYVKNYPKFKENGKGIYFYSSIKGSGKTRLACSLGNALIQKWYVSLKFIKTTDLLQNIRSTYGRNADVSEKMILDNFKKSQLLILDDIGAERPNEWACEIFLNILDYRMTNKLPTIFTSNILMGNLQLDERILDRIYKSAIEVRLPEESIRSVQSKNENKELEALLYE